MLVSFFFKKKKDKKFLNIINIIGYTMSEIICPKCKSKISKENKYCPNCGSTLYDYKINVNEIRDNFMNFKDDITSKIQNKLENEDIPKTDEIKDILKNLDEDSLNMLLDKHGISPSKLKQLNLNKLSIKVDTTKLKEDLAELGIKSPKRNSDNRSVKVDIVDGEFYDASQNESPSFKVEVESELNEDSSSGIKIEVDDDTVEEELQEKNEPVAEEDSDIYICSKCGFKNRLNIKFCTNCGNKLI